MRHQPCCGAFTFSDRHKGWCDRSVWDDRHYVRAGMGTALWPGDVFGEKRLKQRAMREAKRIIEAVYGQKKESK